MSKLERNLNYFTENIMIIIIYQVLLYSIIMITQI